MTRAEAKATNTNVTLAIPKGQPLDALEDKPPEFVLR
jgi:hypothetical protein